MGLPKKGSRKIVVDANRFRYIVSGNDGYIDLIIEAENCKGQRLTVSFVYLHAPKTTIDKSGQVITSLQQLNQITPGVVRQVIEYAILNGWTPFQKEKEMRISKMDENINLNLSSGSNA